MRWGKRWGVSAVTSRKVILSRSLRYADETSLKNIRAFVASLEKWPDNATVRATLDAVLKVGYTTDAPTYIGEDATE